jgi:hypothetical protein
MKRDASCRSSANPNPERLPSNLRAPGATKITPPLNGMATSLSRLFMPDISLVFLSSRTLYLSSSSTSPKGYLLIRRFSHILRIFPTASECAVNRLESAEWNLNLLHLMYSTPRTQDVRSCREDQSASLEKYRSSFSFGEQPNVNSLDDLRH